MKSTRWVLIAAVMLCTTLFAQGLRPQGRDQQQQLWLKFEKELGLQTRYTVDMEIQAMGMTMPSKMYRTEGKMRSDMTLPVMAMRMVALELTEEDVRELLAKKWKTLEDMVGGKAPEVGGR